ncbi:Uncharacterised protein [Serratia fonticola]|uniref:High-copy suppressor of rspA n=1 Tax=Serratia fonticola TaxID=47917 RepID=A0A4U9UE79_SERFO|nr:Uncharacterised protein [Serratia fonticola]
MGTGVQHPLQLLPGLMILGFGQALSMTPLLNWVLGLAKEHQAGMAAGLVSTVQQVGGALGIAASGMFLCSAAGPGGAEPQHYARAFAGAMGYNLLAMLVALVLLLYTHRQLGRGG